MTLRPTGIHGSSTNPSDRLRLFETNLEELIECVQMSGRVYPCDACEPLLLVTATHDRQLLRAWRKFHPRAMETAC